MPGRIIADEVESEEIEQDQFLVFQVKEQEFGIQAMWVQEISRPLKVTPVPNVPSYIDGVANLRGRLSTVINFRKKFGFEEKAHDEDTRLIVIEHLGFPLGLLVDAVEEVTKIPVNQVQKMSEAAGSPAQSKMITGIGMLNDRMIIMLDIQKVLEKTTLIDTEEINRAIAGKQDLVKENNRDPEGRHKKEERHGEDLDRG